MFYLVYKIIQLSTGREYIGQHQTSNLNDGYMGSGTLIAQAVEENPNDFVKTILWYCDSDDEMNELEAALVTEEYLLANFPEKTFNQVPGGKVSMDVVNKWSKKLNPHKFDKPKRYIKKWNPNSQVSEEQWNAGYTTIGKIQRALTKAIRSGDWPEVLVGYKEQYREVFENSMTTMDFEEFIGYSTAVQCINGSLSIAQQKIIDGLVYDEKCGRFVSSEPKWPWYHIHNMSRKARNLYSGRAKGLKGDVALFHEFSGLTKLGVTELSLQEWKVLKSMWNN